MLFRQDILQGIADGRVTLAFRRWRKAPPADGSTLRTPVGVLFLGPVTIIDESDITPDDVRRTVCRRMPCAHHLPARARCCAWSCA
jgi:hypothetical protein